VTQDVVIPMAVKAFAPSKVHVVEFEAVLRQSVPTLSIDSLQVASEAVYELVPPVPGIGT
jgi:hypothetical protein